MRSARLLLIAVSLVCFAPLLHSEDPFTTDTEAFRVGYLEGYHHGAIDKGAGLSSNYQHSHKFQSGISFKTYNNSQFHAGYKAGYQDGFDSRALQFDSQLEFESDEEAYKVGYSEGYNHGMADQSAGQKFNYSHDHKFQSGITFESYTHARFRTGYKDGYEDGYYKRSFEMMK